MNQPMIRKSGLLLFLLFLALTAQAQLKHIVFTPQWNPNAQFAGYIAARELGYFKEEGLDVTIKFPKANISSLELLKKGKADIVTSLLTKAIEMKSNEGLDIVNVLQTSQHAAICLALRSPKKNFDIKSLKGMRVGLWHNGLAIACEAMNNQYRLNWKIVPFRRGFKLLSYGVLDAMSVMEYNELQQLKYNGYDVSEHSVLRLSDHGYDIPEDGIYCMNDYYNAHTNEVQAFVRATKKGWEWCRQNPEAATKFVIKEMYNEHFDYNEVMQRAGLKVILKKQELVPGQVGYSLQKEQYDKAVNMLKDAGLITTIPDFQTFIAR